MRSLLIAIGIFTSPSLWALQGIEPIRSEMLRNNPEVKIFQLQVEAAKSEISASKLNHLPQLAVKSDWTEENGFNNYFEAQLNLFSGFEILNDTKGSKTTAEIEKFNYEKKLRELNEKLINTLSDIIYFHKSQKILEKELAINKEQRKMAERKISAGMATQLDSLELDLREEEIRILKSQLEKDHRELHTRLEEIVGVEISEDQIDALEFDSTLSKEIPRLNNHRSIDTQIGELELQRQKFIVKSARSGYWPKLDLTYSFGHFKKDRWQGEDIENQLSLALTIPLFSAFGSHYKQKSQSFIKTAMEHNLEKIKLATKQSEEMLSAKFDEVQDLFNINKRKINLAKKYYDITVFEYKKGLKNSADLAAATERWFDLQRKEFELLKEYEKLKIQIHNLQPI